MLDSHLLNQRAALAHQTSSNIVQCLEEAKRSKILTDENQFDISPGTLLDFNPQRDPQIQPNLKLNKMKVRVMCQTSLS